MGNVQYPCGNINTDQRASGFAGVVGIGRQYTPQGTAIAVKGCWAGRRGNYAVVPDNPEVLDSLNFNDSVEVVNVVVLGTCPRITLRGEVRCLRPYGVKQP